MVNSFEADNLPALAINTQDEDRHHVFVDPRCLLDKVQFMATNMEGQHQEIRTLQHKVDALTYEVRSLMTLMRGNMHAQEDSEDVEKFIPPWDVCVQIWENAASVEDKYFAWFDNDFPSSFASIPLPNSEEEKKYRVQQQRKYFRMKDFMLAMMRFTESYPDDRPSGGSVTLDDLEEWKARIKAQAADAANECKLHLVKKDAMEASAKLSASCVCDGVKKHYAHKPLPDDMPEDSPIHKDEKKKRGGAKK